MKRNWFLTSATNWWDWMLCVFVFVCKFSILSERWCLLTPVILLWYELNLCTRHNCSNFKRIKLCYAICRGHSMNLRHTIHYTAFFSGHFDCWLSFHSSKKSILTLWLWHLMENYEQSSSDAIDQNCGEAKQTKTKPIKEKGLKGIKNKEEEKNDIVCCNDIPSLMVRRTHFLCAFTSINSFR